MPIINGQWQPNPPNQPNQSVEQSVQNNNPQSVQNFMTALHNVGAGNNNNMMNNQSQLGQPAQAGFTGFNPPQQQQQQNYQPQQQQYQQSIYQPQQNYQQFQPQPQQQMNYYNPIQTQLGYAFNQARTNGDQLKQNYVSENSAQQGQQLSDKESKKEIKSGDIELKDFLNSLGVYSYEYKDKKYGEGRRISPMAQEIESTPLGKDAIETNSEGYKMVNYGKLAGVQLAALAYLNNRQNKFEEKMRSAINEKLKSRKK